MNSTKALHEVGQSLWLDNITRELLNGGVLRRYIDELSVTGLTSNPTIFDHAINLRCQARPGRQAQKSRSEIRSTPLNASLHAN